MSGSELIDAIDLSIPPLEYFLSDWQYVDDNCDADNVEESKVVMDCNEHLKVNLSWAIDTVDDNCDNDDEAQ